MACGGCGGIIHGATGLAKAGLQLAGVSIDAVPDKVMLSRRDQCRECEYATRNKQRLNRTTKGLTASSICTKCNCNIRAKTRLASEECPIGRWSKFSLPVIG